MKPYEFLEQSQDFVYKQITEQTTNGKERWYCDNCMRNVIGEEHHIVDGLDDTVSGEVVCEICGNLLWED